MAATVHDIDRKKRTNLPLHQTEEAFSRSFYQKLICFEVFDLLCTVDGSCIEKGGTKHMAGVGGLSKEKENSKVYLFSGPSLSSNAFDVEMEA